MGPLDETSVNSPVESLNEAQERLDRDIQIHRLREELQRIEAGQRDMQIGDDRMPVSTPPITAREAAAREAVERTIEQQAANIYEDMMDEARRRDIQMLRDNPIIQMSTRPGIQNYGPELTSPNSLRGPSQYDIDYVAAWNNDAGEESGILENIRNGVSDIEGGGIRASHKMDKFFSNSVSCPECENTFLIGDGDFELICPGCKFEFSAPDRHKRSVGETISEGAAIMGNVNYGIRAMDNLVWGHDAAINTTTRTAMFTGSTTPYQQSSATMQALSVPPDRPITASEIMINERNHGH